MTQNKGECLQRVSLRLSYESNTTLEQCLNLWLPCNLGLELIDITRATSGREQTDGLGREKRRGRKTYEVNIFSFDRKLIVAEFVKDLERHCMNNKNAYIFGIYFEIGNEHKGMYNSAFD